MKYIRVEGKVAFVELTQGCEAMVDASDIELVRGRSWHAVKARSAVYAYANGVAMHRLITNAPRGKEVDHINHDALDNRRANLRVCSHKENMENSKNALATHCPRGHSYDEANTYRNAKGDRICRTCNAERVSAIYAKQSLEQREERRARVKAYYEANYDELRAKQNAYAAARRAEKQEYDRTHRAEANARRRARKVRKLDQSVL